MTEAYKQTPNVNKGKTITPTLVVLHHTSGSYAGSVDWCLKPESSVSYHCIVARNGDRTVLAKPNQRTWHAGRSSWKGKPDCNIYSVGLAWEGDTYKTPLSKAAIDSAVEYLVPIIKQYKIPLDRIVRHEDVAPGRKNDCSPQAQKEFLEALKKKL